MQDKGSQPGGAPAPSALNAWMTSDFHFVPAAPQPGAGATAPPPRPPLSKASMAFGALGWGRTPTAAAGQASKRTGGGGGAGPSTCSDSGSGQPGSFLEAASPAGSQRSSRSSGGGAKNTLAYVFRGRHVSAGGAGPVPVSSRLASAANTAGTAPGADPTWHHLGHHYPHNLAHTAPPSRASSEAGGRSVAATPSRDSVLSYDESVAAAASAADPRVRSSARSLFGPRVDGANGGSPATTVPPETPGLGSPERSPPRRTRSSGSLLGSLLAAPVAYPQPRLASVALGSTGPMGIPALPPSQHHLQHPAHMPPGVQANNRAPRATSMHQSGPEAAAASTAPSLGRVSEDEDDGHLQGGQLPAVEPTNSSSSRTNAGDGPAAVSWGKDEEGAFAAVASAPTLVLLRVLGGRLLEATLRWPAGVSACALVVAVAAWWLAVMAAVMAWVAAPAAAARWALGCVGLGAGVQSAARGAAAGRGSRKEEAGAEGGCGGGVSTDGGCRQG